jgi:ribosomal protein S3AE
VTTNNETRHQQGDIQMAQDKKKVKKGGKSKVKKKWLQVLAPKSFDNKVLGETHVAENDKAIGKSVTANLMNLTGDMRKQGIQIRFDVLKVADGAAQTAVTGYELLPSQLKRLIRRGRSKVADSFIVRTSTNRLIRIKPVVVTTNRASISAQNAIRLAVRARVKELVGATSFDKLVQDLIGIKFQRTLKETAGKIHPIRSVDVKACFLLPEGSSENKVIKEDRRDEDFVEVKEEPPKKELKLEKTPVAEPAKEAAEESEEPQTAETPAPAKEDSDEKQAE